MNIKEIAKRNLKNMVRTAFNIAISPFTFGFAHASYLYFYIARPHGNEKSLDWFMHKQVEGFEDSVNGILDKLYDTLDKDEDPSKWEDRIERLRDTINENKDGRSDFRDWSLFEFVCDNIKELGYVDYSDRMNIRRLEEKYGLRKENE